MISTVLTGVVEGLGTMVPAFFEALLTGFTSLFIATGDGGAVTLTAVGEISIVFLIIAMCYRIAPTVCGWLKLAFVRKPKKKSRAK